MKNRLCLVRLGKATRTTFSTNAALSWESNIGIYYDGSHHYAFAAWDWVNNSYQNDVNCPIFACDIGGLDGWGISLNTKATAVGQPYSSVWGDWNYACCTKITALADNGPVGVAFTRQDRMYNNGSGRVDLNIKHGQVIYPFENYGSKCHSYQLFGKMGHSWQNTSLTGISIGVWSIGISWTSTPDHWTSASVGSPTTRLC